jgi:hypothetical protein
MRTPPIAKGGFLLSEHDDPNPADPLDRAMPDMTAPGRDPLAGSPTGGAADVSRHPAAIRHQRSHLQSARGPFATGFLEPPKMNFLRAAISPDQQVMQDRGADPFCRFSQSKHGGRPRDRR